MTDDQTPQSVAGEKAESFLERRLAFGEILRSARVLSGCSINELSQSTRISKDFLEALEEGRFEVLPGAVFARGFIRSVCKSLRIDPVPLITAFDASLETAPEKPTQLEIPIGQRDVHSGLRKKRSAQSRGSSVLLKGVDPRIIVAAGVAVLVGLGALVFALQPPKGGMVNNPASGLASQGAKSSHLQPKSVTGPPTAVEAGTSLVVGNTESIGADSETPISQSDRKVAPGSPATLPAAVPVSPGDTAALAQKKEVSKSVAPIVAAVTTEPEVPPTGGKAGTQVIELVVKEAVKVRIKVDKGEQTTLDLQPNTYTYQFQDRAEFMIYDAGSAEMHFNGKSLGSLGSKGRVRRLSFRAAEPDSKKM